MWRPPNYVIMAATAPTKICRAWNLFELGAKTRLDSIITSKIGSLELILTVVVFDDVSDRVKVRALNEANLHARGWIRSSCQGPDGPGGLRAVHDAETANRQFGTALHLDRNKFVNERGNAVVKDPEFARIMLGGRFDAVVNVRVAFATAEITPQVRRKQSRLLRGEYRM